MSKKRKAVYYVKELGLVILFAISMVVLIFYPPKADKHREPAKQENLLPEKTPRAVKAPLLEKPLTKASPAAVVTPVSSKKEAPAPRSALEYVPQFIDYLISQIPKIETPFLKRRSVKVTNMLIIPEMMTGVTCSILTKEGYQGVKSVDIKNKSAVAHVSLKGQDKNYSAGGIKFEFPSALNMSGADMHFCMKVSAWSLDSPEIVLVTPFAESSNGKVQSGRVTFITVDSSNNWHEAWEYNASPKKSEPGFDSQHITAIGVVIQKRGPGEFDKDVEFYFRIENLPDQLRQ
jgi:hypothetical protein